MARLPKRKMRINAVSARMFAAIGATMPGLQGKLLKRLSNPLVRAVVGPKLAALPLMNAMLRDTISMTQLEAGYKINVIPESAEAGIDCRLLPDTDPDEFEAWLRRHLADERIALERLEQSAKAEIAPIEGAFFDAVRGALAETTPGAVVVPLQMPGGSDARFFRQRGIPAYGFAPLCHRSSGDGSRARGRRADIDRQLGAGRRGMRPRDSHAMRLGERR